MRRSLSIALILLGMAIAACTAPALVLQREAEHSFERARLAVTSLTGHERDHARLCRDSAAHAEDIAYRGYPLATAAGRAAITDMRKDCAGLPVVPAPTPLAVPAPSPALPMTPMKPAAEREAIHALVSGAPLDMGAHPGPQDGGPHG